MNTVASASGASAASQLSITSAAGVPSATVVPYLSACIQDGCSAKCTCSRDDACREYALSAL